MARYAGDYEYELSTPDGLSLWLTGEYFFDRTYTIDAILLMLDENGHDGEGRPVDYDVTPADRSKVQDWIDFMLDEHNDGFDYEEDYAR